MLKPKKASTNIDRIINNTFFKSKLKFCDVILNDFLAILVVLDFKSSNLLELVFPVKFSNADLLLILKFSNGDLLLEVKLFLLS